MSNEFKVGDFIMANDITDEYSLPVFVWAIVHDEPKWFYVINSLNGDHKEKIIEKFPNHKFVLPNHAKFDIVSHNQITSSFSLRKQGSLFNFYSHIPVIIRNAQFLEGGNKVINWGYSLMHIMYTMALSQSTQFLSISEEIKKDVHYTGSKDPFAYIALDSISKDFLLLKTIQSMKEIVSSNFPARGEDYNNSLYEQLVIGAMATYWMQHRDKIKSATINYERKFAGKHTKFKEFKSLLFKFEGEMKFHQEMTKSEENIKAELHAKGVTPQPPFDQDGFMFKMLEFDMCFWQTLLLIDVIEIAPVEKTYNGGVSQSYKFMKLLPFFRWLAPHLFPPFETRIYSSDDYQRLMIYEMKSVIEGRTSI